MIYNLFDFSSKTYFVNILRKLNVIKCIKHSASSFTNIVYNKYKFNWWNPITWLICIPTLLATYIVAFTGCIWNYIEDITSIRLIVEEQYRDKEQCQKESKEKQQNNNENETQ